MATPDLQRLAARVTKRRLELNLSLKRAANAAKLSKDTWARVENAEKVRHITYDKLEGALGWTVGSCRKILDGGEPIPLDGEIEFASVPAEQQETVIRQAVQDAMVASTDLNANKIRAINERVIETLRERGILPTAS